MTQPFTLQAGGSVGPLDSLPGERETAPVGLQDTPAFLSLHAWARSRRGSSSRAMRACSEGRVPGAIPFLLRTGRQSFIVPADAPWPAPLPSIHAAPPDGYTFLPNWAKACGRSSTSARRYLAQGRIPEAIRFGVTGHYVAVPEDLPWPAMPAGRPRLQPIKETA